MQMLLLHIKLYDLCLSLLNIIVYIIVNIYLYNILCYSIFESSLLLIFCLYQIFYLCEILIQKAYLL